MMGTKGTAAEAGGSPAARKKEREPSKAGAEEAPPPTGEPAAKKAKRQSAGEEEGGVEAQEGAGGGKTTSKGGGEGGSQGGEGGIIEEGRVQFFYRPKVGKEAVGSLADVQRFFMMLCPGREGAKSRLCVMGKKRLPSARRHERFFGFVEACSADADELLEGLGPQTYQTKTRGERHLGAARAVGQGTYAIVEHRDHTNLVYKLEVPSTPGEAQLEFTIGEEGAFIFVVKNPAGRGPDDPGLDQKADFPEEKQREFGGYSWIPVRDPELLEFEKCEFLLIGAREDEEVTAELGAKEKEMAEGSARRVESACGAESDEECLLASMREEVQAEKTGISVEPAETGKLA